MKNKFLLAIFIISFLASVILSIPQSSDSGFCRADANVGCNSVQNSKYSYTFGIKNSYIGLIAFAFLSFVVFSHIKNPRKNKKLLIDIGIIIGALIAIYFIYLQAFVLKEFCRYCLVVDIGMISALLLIIPWKIKWNEK